MKLSSDEIEILQAHHYPVCYEKDAIDTMELGKWALLDTLDVIGLIEIDNTFAASEGRTYISITTQGSEALRSHLDSERQRHESYLAGALF